MPSSGIGRGRDALPRLPSRQPYGLEVLQWLRRPRDRGPQHRAARSARLMRALRSTSGLYAHDVIADAVRGHWRTFLVATAPTASGRVPHDTDKRLSSGSEERCVGYHPWVPLPDPTVEGSNERRREDLARWRTRGGSPTWPPRRSSRPGSTGAVTRRPSAQTSGLAGRDVSPMRYASTPRAASRPSQIAHTTSDCPRRASPHANTPGTVVW